MSAISGGSSPRGRGTLVAEIGAQGEPRFIPARAGNTGRVTGLCNELPVHPRAGGEHRFFGTLTFMSCGSSPRVRGTP